LSYFKKKQPRGPRQLLSTLKTGEDTLINENVPQTADLAPMPAPGASTIFGAGEALPAAVTSQNGSTYIVTFSQLNLENNSTKPILAPSEVAPMLDDLKVQLEETINPPPPTTSEQLEGLWQSLFWTAIGLAAVLVVHILLRLVIKWREIPVPGSLYWPSLELTIIASFLTIIVAAASGANSRYPCLSGARFASSCSHMFTNLDTIPARPYAW